MDLRRGRIEVVPHSLSYPEPPLDDGRVRPRRWRESDTDCIRLAATDPYIPHTTSVPADFTPEDGLAFVRRQWERVEKGEGVSLAIVDADSDRAIGLVRVALRPQRHVGGLGYWLAPPARGHGAATSAVRLLAPWAMNTWSLQRVEAWVEPDNALRKASCVRLGSSRRGACATS
jgi:[ribosomal protein S5]-alanine N-acetyltransferase